MTADANKLQREFVLTQLARVIENLLSWVDHPTTEPLSDAWLDSHKTAIRDAVNGARALRLDDNTLSRIISAQSLFRQVATLLHAHPKLARMPRLEWPDSTAQPVDELAKLVRFIRTLTASEQPSKTEFNDSGDRLVGTGQLTAFLGVSDRTIRNWLEQGKLPPPDFPSDGNTANEWYWSTLIEPLRAITTINRTIPDDFPRFS